MRCMRRQHTERSKFGKLFTEMEANWLEYALPAEFGKKLV